MFANQYVELWYVKFGATALIVLLDFTPFSGNPLKDMMIFMMQVNGYTGSWL